MIFKNDKLTKSPRSGMLGAAIGLVFRKWDHTDFGFLVVGLCAVALVWLMIWEFQVGLLWPAKTEYLSEERHAVQLLEKRIDEIERQRKLHSEQR